MAIDFERLHFKMSIHSSKLKILNQFVKLAQGWWVALDIRF